MSLPTREQQLTHLENCLGHSYIAVDTEGYAPNILGISIADPFLNSMYFPIGHREAVNLDKETTALLKHVLTKVRYRIFHNAGHDLISLPYLFDLPFLDTMIIGHMVNENLMSKSLDYMHKELCGGEGKKRPELMQSIIDSMGWSYVPYALMYIYATEDAKITMELFIKVKQMYEEQFGSFWSE